MTQKAGHGYSSSAEMAVWHRHGCLLTVVTSLPYTSTEATDAAAGMLEMVP